MSLIATLSGKVRTLKPRVWCFFIVLAGFLVRLYGLTNPLYDRQAWRQTDTAEIARNFFLHGMHLFYPQVGWGGPVGYCETEFPLFNYLVALLYWVAGAAYDWLGRLLSVCFWAAAAWFLWRLTSRHLSQRAALLSVFAYAFMPLGIFYSHAFQPEAFLHMLCLATLDSFDRFLAGGRRRWYLGSLIFLSLGVMVKLPVYLVLPLVVMALSYKGQRALKDAQIWSLALIPIMAGAAWYHHAHYLAEIGTSFSLVGNKWASWSLLTNLNYFWLNMLGRIAGLTLGPVAFACVISELWPNHRAPSLGRRIAVSYFWGVVLFTLVFAYGNVVHDYYQMPWMPPAAMLVGLAWDRLFSARRKLAVVLAVVFPIAGFATVFEHYQPKTVAWNNLTVYQAGLRLKSLAPRTSLVEVADQGSHLPEVFYYSEHHGWHAVLDELTWDWIENYHRQGAEYLVLTDEQGEAGMASFLASRPVGERLVLRCTLVATGDGYRIFKL